MEKVLKLQEVEEGELSSATSSNSILAEGRINGGFGGERIRVSDVDGEKSVVFAGG